MKTLITRSLKLKPEDKNQLEALGLEITYQQDEAAETQQPEQFEAVICYDLFRQNPISRFSRLQYLQLTSAGTDHLPMAEIEGRGIWLNNARGVYSVPMAEFALGGVLQLYKSFPLFGQQQQQRQWKRHTGLGEIAGKTVCIVGVGSIGREMAKRFAAFEARVIGVNPSPVQCPWLKQLLPPERLAEALGQADIVVLCLPLRPDTRQLINGERFAQMKPGALLVNVARGAIVEQQALLEALQSGRLYGAVLDVFETEPLPGESPLWDMPNVLITPHNSFLSESNNARMFQMVLQNLWAYLAQR